MNRTYEQGFMDKCAEYRIDPYVLTKEASRLPLWVVDGLRKAMGTTRTAREIFTPEQMQLAGRMARRAGHGFSRSRSMAAGDVSSFIKGNFPVLGKGTQLTPEGVIRQYEILAKSEGLPSMAKFRTKRSIRDLFDEISKGGPINQHGYLRLSGVGRQGYSSSVGGRVKGAVRSARQKMFSVKPAQRRRMIENYQKWLGVPQPNSPEGVENIANMAADSIRNMKQPR